MSEGGKFNGGEWILSILLNEDLLDEQLINTVLLAVRSQEDATNSEEWIQQNGFSRKDLAERTDLLERATDFR